MHARHTGILVKEARQYACAVSVAKDEKSADAKNIFGAYGLGHPAGRHCEGDRGGRGRENAMKFHVTVTEEDYIAFNLDAMRHYPDAKKNLLIGRLTGLFLSAFVMLSAGLTSPPLLHTTPIPERSAIYPSLPGVILSISAKLTL